MLSSRIRGRIELMDLVTPPFSIRAGAATMSLRAQLGFRGIWIYRTRYRSRPAISASGIGERCLPEVTKDLSLKGLFLADARYRTPFVAHPREGRVDVVHARRSFAGHDCRAMRVGH